MKNNFPWFKPDVNRKLIANEIKKFALKKNLSMGNTVANLEKKLGKLLKIKHVILTTSGTSALMMAYLALGAKNNSKVLSSNMNWIATLNPAKILNSKVFVVDTEKMSHNVNYRLLNKKILQLKPDIVVITHLNGNSSFNKQFDALKKKLKFKVIEDTAQAFMVKYKKKFCGTFYDIGCFSLSITKITNMIYGGFCVTNSTKIANNLRAIRNNGVDGLPENAMLQLAKHRGLNFKSSDLNAKIGLINLNNLQSKIIKINKIHDYYFKNLSNKNLIFIKKENKRSIPIYNYVYVKNRKKFIKFCKTKRIGIHLGLRTITENSTFKSNNKKFPNSFLISKNFVRIPSGPGYSLEEIKKITKKLNSF